MNVAPFFNGSTVELITPAHVSAYFASLSQKVIGSPDPASEFETQLPQVVELVRRACLGKTDVTDRLWRIAEAAGVLIEHDEDWLQERLATAFSHSKPEPSSLRPGASEMIEDGVKQQPQAWHAKIVKASDLQTMTFPPVRHILPDYISEGATILAGKPKIGKSWLTLDLCLAAAANRFTLGTLKPVHGDVLYLALEDNNRRLKKRMSKIWPSSEAVWPKRLALVTEWRRADEGGLDDIEEWCRSVTDPVMVVIDTLEKFRPVQNGKSAAYSADYAALTGLQKVAGKHRIAIVVNHHVRKMEADDPFDTVSGTLGLTGAADTIIVLKRHAGAVTLHARGRDIEEVETALQFERATCRWTILGSAAEVYVSNERAAVLKALGNAGSDGLAVSEIMAATGSSNRGAVDTLLFKMKDGGEIARIKRGVYALPNADEQDPGKIGQKERLRGQAAENTQLNGNLTNLTDLTASANSGDKAPFLGAQLVHEGMVS